MLPIHLLGNNIFHNDMITYFKEGINLKYIRRIFWDLANQFVSEALLELGMPVCIPSVAAFKLQW